MNQSQINDLIDENRRLKTSLRMANEANSMLIDLTNLFKDQVEEYEHEKALEMDFTRDRCDCNCSCRS